MSEVKPHKRSGFLPDYRIQRYDKILTCARKRTEKHTFWQKQSLYFLFSVKMSNYAKINLMRINMEVTKKLAQQHGLSASTGWDCASLLPMTKSQQPNNYDQ